jgi:hypothetical protein
MSSALESSPASMGPSLQHCTGYVSTHPRSRFGLQDAQSLPAKSTVIPAGRPCRCCSFTMFRRGHLPEPTLNGLQCPPDSPPGTPHTNSTCPWCHFDITLPDVPSSARDLPWLLCIHYAKPSLLVPTSISTSDAHSPSITDSNRAKSFWYCTSAR